jgi:hypothetical protein
VNEKDAAKSTALIRAYLDLRAESGQTPAPQELCRKAGMSYNEAMRLMGRLTPDDAARPVRLLTAAVVEALAYKAMQGDAKAAELFFKYAWGTAPTSVRDKPENGPVIKFPDGHTL